MNGIQPSPTVPFVDTVLREETDRSKPSAGPSAAQSRRAKNAAHRADDVGGCRLCRLLSFHLMMSFFFATPRIRVRDWEWTARGG